MSLWWMEGEFIQNSQKCICLLLTVAGSRVDRISKLNVEASRKSLNQFISW